MQKPNLIKKVLKDALDVYKRQEYAHTRHNIGFDVVDVFVQQHNTLFVSNRLADTATVRWKGKIFVCIKPNTYMNLSGKAVAYWMQKEKIDIQNILVIVDDLALPLSTSRQMCIRDSCRRASRTRW